MDEIIDWLKPENRFKATPMDLFKQGLLQENWEAVRAAYMMLTGDKIEPVKKSGTIINFPVPENTAITLEAKPPIKFIPAEVPQDVLDKATAPEKTSEAIEKVASTPPDLSSCVAPAKAKDNKRKTKFFKHNTNPRKLIWEDKGDLSPEEIVKNRTVPKELLDTRPPAPFVKVRCASCGKVEQVEAAFAASLRLTSKYQMKYKCNDCQTSGPSDIDYMDADTEEEEDDDGDEE